MSILDRFWKSRSTYSENWKKCPSCGEDLRIMKVKETMDNYSVLMSVYFKEKAEYLKDAMNSIWNQSFPTNDFVLVCDGPLNDDLNATISEMEEKHSQLNVIRLKENGGLGNALNIGLKYCKNDLVARMDSDDVCRSDRCERQLEVFNRNSEISICSGIIEEFANSLEEVESRRVVPETNEEIVRFAKQRNPFNHPCVMYKKDAVEDAGGYIDFHYLEDYYLWIRMILNGSEGYNIQEPLLWMRTGNGLYNRRGGKDYAKSEKRLFEFMLERGFISKMQFYKAVLSRTVVAMSPNWIRKVAYKLVLRRRG